MAVLKSPNSKFYLLSFFEGVLVQQIKEYYAWGTYLILAECHGLLQRNEATDNIFHLKKIKANTKR